jgi:hypothetical protein
METLKKHGVPADILAIIAKPPLLKGESKDDYFELLAGIIDDLGASDRPEFLWAIRYADSTWEIIRLRRMRTLIIEHWRDRGRIALLQDRLPGTYPAIEQRLGEVYPDGIDPELVNARSMILADANSQLAYLDDAIESLERRCDSILQLFEGRREIFAHRQRERERVRTAREVEQLRIEKRRFEAENRSEAAAQTVAADSKEEEKGARH